MRKGKATNLHRTIATTALALTLALTLPAALPARSGNAAQAEAAVKKAKAPKKVTVKKGKKKTIKVKNIRKITKVKSSKKSVVTAKKKGKKIVVRGKKKGTATVKVTVKNLKGKKQTLTVKVKVGTITSKGKKKGYYTKHGEKYISKWDYDAKDKVYIEDQHITVKLISQSLDTNNGMWPENPYEGNSYYYNTFTFSVTNHRTKPVTFYNQMGVMAAVQTSPYYKNTYYWNDPDYPDKPDLYSGFLAFSSGNVTIQPGETKVITYTQPEAHAYYGEDGQPGPQEDDTLQLLYRDEIEDKVARFSPYYGSSAFTLREFYCG